MVDEYGILEKINKSKRKKLMVWLKQHDTDGAKIIPAINSNDLPKNPKADKGTMALFCTGQSIYSHKQGFWCLVDILDHKGRENFMDFYKRQSAILELMDIEPTEEQQERQEGQSDSYDPKMQYVISRAKTGRPKRILSESEKEQIAELRAQGKGIAYIARTLKASNRFIMDYLKSQKETHGISPDYYQNHF